MDRNTKILKLKLDIIFKRIFGDPANKNIIKTFIEDLLELPQGSIQELYMDNVELVPENIDHKFSRLDLKIKVDDMIVNIEMQVNYEYYFNDRTLFYWSKLYSGELMDGEEYDKLRQTICINIVNFNLFKSDDYHSHFKIMEKTRHEVLTEKFAIHFFELKKINKRRNKKRMEDWLDLINAETEGDLMDIQKETSIPEVKEVIFKLRELSADEQLKWDVYYREKRLHDEASALSGARKEGIEIGRAEGRAEGRIEGQNEFVAFLKKKWRSEGKSEEEIEKLLSE